MIIVRERIATWIIVEKRVTVTLTALGEKSDSDINVTTGIGQGRW